MSLDCLRRLIELLCKARGEGLRCAIARSRKINRQARTKVQAKAPATAPTRNLSRASPRSDTPTTTTQAMRHPQRSVPGATITKSHPGARSSFGAGVLNPGFTFPIRRQKKTRLRKKSSTKRRRLLVEHRGLHRGHRISDLRIRRLVVSRLRCRMTGQAQNAKQEDNHRVPPANDPA